jgi:hypothetical protein
VLKYIPVTLVRVRACEIWWIILFIYFISLIIIKETSNSWNRSPVNQQTQCYILSRLNKARNLISYTWTAEHTSSLCNMNLYAMINDSKNHSRRSEYSDLVCCLPSRYCTYLIPWSCWEVSLASLGNKLYQITY